MFLALFVLPLAYFCGFGDGGGDLDMCAKTIELSYINFWISSFLLICYGIYIKSKNFVLFNLSITLSLVVNYYLYFQLLAFCIILPIGIYYFIKYFFEVFALRKS